MGEHGFGWAWVVGLSTDVIAEEKDELLPLPAFCGFAALFGCHVGWFTGTSEDSLNPESQTLNPDYSPDIGREMSEGSHHTKNTV